MSAPFSHALSQPNPFGLERKMKKPLMEKRRRARINHCLLELKSLLLQAGPHQRTKLEKADILEMTVQHVKKMGSSPKSHDTSVVRQSYVDGYSGCAGAVLQYFNAQPQLADTPLRLGLVNHLNGFLADRMKSLPPPSAVPQKHHHQSRVSTSISVKIPQQTSTSVASAFAPLQPTNNAHFQPSGSELPTPPYSLPDQGRSAFRRESGASGSFPVDFRRDSAADSPFSMDASSNGDTNSSLSPVSSVGGDLASPFPRGSPQKQTAAVWRPW